MKHLILIAAASLSGISRIVLGRRITHDLAINAKPPAESKEEGKDKEPKASEAAEPALVSPTPTVEDWAASELKKFNTAIALGQALADADLDPAIREKLKAGLTIDQAVEVLSAQRRHDAAQAEKQPAKSAE